VYFVLFRIKVFFNKQLSVLASLWVETINQSSIQMQSAWKLVLHMKSASICNLVKNILILLEMCFHSLNYVFNNYKILTYMQYCKHDDSISNLLQHIHSNNKFIVDRCLKSLRNLMPKYIYELWEISMCGI
jgi:hypothetical protein